MSPLEEILPVDSRIFVVVDDDPRVCESLTSLLKSAGVAVRTFTFASDVWSGDALALAPCLVCDICMPKTDGWALQREAHAAYPDLPVIFGPAQHDEKTSPRDLACGAFAVLKKPFDGEDLLRTVEAAFSHYTGSPIMSLTTPYRICTTAFVAGITLLAGCAVVLPHASVSPPDRGIEQCSLDLLEYRRRLPTQIAALGVATPVIVRHASSGTDRLLRYGQDLYFIDTHAHASRLPNGDAGDGQWLSKNASRSANDSSRWVLDDIDRQPGDAPTDGVIPDRARVRLRAPGGDYLRLIEGREGTLGTLEAASRVVIYKIDVPDATRPTSCDGSLRDGDFVFMQALEPNRWVDSSENGTLLSLPATNPGAGNIDYAAHCVQQRQRCYTDDRGGMACAWAPQCTF